MTQSSRRANFIVRVVATAVLVNGLFLIVFTLIEQFINHGSHRVSSLGVQITLLIGLTLIYLSNLLWRRKQNAWIVSLVVYGFYIGLSINLRVHDALAGTHVSILAMARSYVIPIIVVAGLLFARNNYNVKSDVRSFGVSIRITLIVLLVALLYGVSGFVLMDNSDFHHEIDMPEAFHRTIDQLGLTTSHQLVPYTRRARVFLDSLSVISVGALAYTAISFFQPIRARYGDQTANRQRAAQLLAGHPGSSEDFFKLWPYDKGYFFNQAGNTGVAFRVHRGIALVVGDPFGNPSKFPNLIREFTEFCRINDWVPSFIHIEPRYVDLYGKRGFTLQKIGEEAVLNIDHYNNDVINNKYFRNINNRFVKAGYTAETLTPPHSQETLKELKRVSDDWLKLPGRAERGLMMGYFSEPYMRLCNIVVLKDDQSKIQAFINQVPSYDRAEANYDLLRQSSDSLSNSADYLLMNFIKYASEQGYTRVNLGLCPLVGLDKKDKDYSLIDRTLQFVYSNSDRFYSFSGLHRFKAKYEPNWSERYVAYKGGIRGLIGTVNALGACMKPHHQLSVSSRDRVIAQENVSTV